MRIPPLFYYLLVPMHLACRGDSATAMDASADAGQDAPEAGRTDAGAGPSCPSPLNPTGEFANVLIRARAPDAPFQGNTWQAVADADVRGFAYVEVDVRVSADGFLIPCREDDLSTWSTCSGSLAGATLADLDGCLYSETQTSVRPVDEGLRGARFRAVYLDLKSTVSAPLSGPAETAEAVRALADRLAFGDRLVAMPYEEQTIDALVALGVRAALKGYFEDGEVPLALEKANAHLAEMVCLNIGLLNAGLFDRARGAGLWLLPWAYEDQIDERAMSLLAEGQAGGLISSVPERVQSLRSGLCGL